MTLEQFTTHHHQVVDKYVEPIANYQMKTYDYVLRPAANGDTGAFTITLPSVSEARGRFYSIVCRNADAVNTITIQDKDDSECWAGDVTFNGKCDRMLLYSDGLTWFVFGNITTFTGTTPTPTTVAPTTAAA